MKISTPTRTPRQFLRAVLTALARDRLPELVQCPECWGVTPNDDDSIARHRRWHRDMRFRP
jgi:hypothetical protein